MKELATAHASRIRWMQLSLPLAGGGLDSRGTFDTGVWLSPEAKGQVMALSTT